MSSSHRQIKSSYHDSSSGLRIHSAGLCCSVGYQLSAASCALRAHMDHFQNSEFLAPMGEPVVVARLPDDTLWGQARLSRWLELAILDCLAMNGDLDTRDIPLVWLAPEPQRHDAEPEWYTAIFDQTLERVGKLFHPDSIIVPQGRAGLAQALAQAAHLLQQKRCSHVLLAGVDSYLDSGTINQYLGAERLQVTGNSDGFIPGEAAAAILLHLDHTDSPGLYILGFGQAQEEGRPDGSVPSRAKGLTNAIRNALTMSQLSYQDLEFRISDQNGEAFFSREANNAMTRVAPPGGRKLPVITLADCIGEVGAATGPAMLAFMFEKMARDTHPGHRGLLHLANDDGLRSAAILHYVAGHSTLGS
jgi:3-oxoacyl-[acyl-carrier-protein] synthase I